MLIIGDTYDLGLRPAQNDGVECRVITFCLGGVQSSHSSQTAGTTPGARSTGNLGWPLLYYGQWDVPTVVIRNPGMPPGNAVVFSDAVDRIWLVWGRMESPRPIRRGGGWRECQLMYRISVDSGLTWSRDKPMIEEGFLLPRNLPMRLRSGTLALPISGRLGDEEGAFILMTDDHGVTWKASTPIKGGSQPTVVERDDGSLFTMLRSKPKSKQCVSFDKGRTWSPTVNSTLKNPGAGVAMLQLRFPDHRHDKVLVIILRSLPQQDQVRCRANWYGSLGSPVPPEYWPWALTDTIRTKITFSRRECLRRFMTSSPSGRRLRRAGRSSRAG